MKPAIRNIVQSVLNLTLIAAFVAAAALAAAGPVRADGGAYTVQAGDTLTKIARANAVPLDDLKKANSLTSDVIFPGQKLVIPSVTLVGRAVGAGSFNTLVAAVKAAGLVDALNGAGPLTVFAPTDAAFAKLPAGTVEALLKDPETLRKILLYHVASGKFTAADVVGVSSVASLEGESIAVKVVDGKVILNGASTVVATDISASNGVIHVIDSVILPPSLSAAKPAAASSAAAAPGQVTVQTGDTLSKIARANLVTLADLKAANNLTSDVIFPGQHLIVPTPDIVGRAQGAGTFNTLLAAAKAAGLVDALKGAGPLTVFAPSDAAFAKLPAGTVNLLLANPDLLKKVLLYHVVAGQVQAADVVKLSSAQTLNGASVAIKVVDGKVVLNGATTVVATDIQASNGVIHVIDSVLLPPFDVLDTAVLNGNFKTLVAAVKAAGLESALRGAGPFTVFAPTDAAFAKLPAGTVAKLLNDPAALKNILLYHVVAGQVKAADVVKLSSAATLQGGSVSIHVTGGKVTVNGANVVAVDVAASNGVIHVIDTVLLP